MWAHGLREQRGIPIPREPDRLVWVYDVLVDEYRVSSETGTIEGLGQYTIADLNVTINALAVW